MRYLIITVSPITARLEEEKANEIMEMFSGGIQAALKDDMSKYNESFRNSDILIDGFVNLKSLSFPIFAYGNNNFMTDVITSILLIAIKHSEIFYQKSSEIEQIVLDVFSLSEGFYDIRNIDQFRLKIDLEIKDLKIENVKVSTFLNEKNHGKGTNLNDELDMMFDRVFDIRNLESEIFKAKGKVDKNEILKYEIEYKLIIDKPKESGYIEGFETNLMNFAFQGMN